MLAPNWLLGSLVWDGFGAGIRDGLGDGIRDGIGDGIRDGIVFVFPGSLITIWRCPGGTDTLPGMTSSRGQTIPAETGILLNCEFMVFCGCATFGLAAPL